MARIDEVAQSLQFFLQRSHDVLHLFRVGFLQGFHAFVSLVLEYLGAFQHLFLKLRTHLLPCEVQFCAEFLFPVSLRFLRVLLGLLQQALCSLQVSFEGRVFGCEFLFRFPFADEGFLCLVYLAVGMLTQHLQFLLQFHNLHSVFSLQSYSHVFVVPGIRLSSISQGIYSEGYGKYDSGQCYD